MELDEILNSINKVSTLSEQYFLSLGELFPSLLNREGSTSLQNLQKILLRLKEGNEKSSESEKTLFSGYAEKYNPLFDELNEKISALSELDKMIADIKEDSEQMELIALNAMVISIKSGERGQAFSRITENLQRLSNDMFIFSDKLMEEEKLLIDHINSLRKIFTDILDSQKKLSQKGEVGTNGIDDLISNVVTPLKNIEENINSIYPSIQKSMQTLQLQDIVRQSMDQVKTCLNEIKNTTRQVAGSDEELDSICFCAKAYELCITMLTYVIDQITTSFMEFDQNWSNVTEILTDVETKKTMFYDTFIDQSKLREENITLRLARIINNFQALMEEFSNYHLVQKDLLHVTQNITEKARTMFSVFSNIRPVMSRLHHVRILQQIEVAKNEAITSVKDSVTDMDNLITAANNSLDSMEGLLSQFISETNKLLTNFTESISIDNSSMLALRREKSVFFDNLKSTQGQLGSVISSFAVFPAGFTEKCNNVASNLSGIVDLNLEIKKFRDEFTSAKNELEEKRKAAFASRNISNWDIKNSRFKELINHFTIASHKESAGKIGGFDIEKGTAPSGEITLF